MRSHSTSKGRSNEKKAFFAGVFWLTVSGILVKIAGLCFRIPMNYVVGDTGMGYYNSAYSVYTFLYMLSTSGLPVALSVLVSEARSRGEKRTVRRVFLVGLALFSAIGAVSAAGMFFFARPLAGMIRSEASAASVAVIAPTMLFVCVSSALRGYFQGCGNMIPTAVSQLIEAVGKLFFGVGAAVYAVRAGYAVHIVAAYAVSGLTVGSLFGMVYLITAALLRGPGDERDLLCEVETAPSFGDTLRRLVKKAIPVTVSASVMSLSAVTDTVLIQRVLRSSGMTAEEAASLYGNYTSLAVPMFNLPPVFVYPVAYSIVPVVAALIARGNKEAAAERTESALRYAVIVGLPCALGMCVLSEPILSLIYKAESAASAAPLLTCLAPSSFLVCILAVTNSVLDGCGREKSTVVSMLCGALVKAAAGKFLLERYGIMGAPLSTLLCYLTVCTVNFALVVRHIGIKPGLWRTFVLPLVGSVLSSLTAVAVVRIPVFPGKTACIAAIASAVIVYGVFILCTGCVSAGEIKEIIKSKRKAENET